MVIDITFTTTCIFITFQDIIRWIEELNKFPDKYAVHQLHQAYPDEKIDVEAEQKLTENYDKIVFQFQLYWFSSPPLLKK